MKRKEYEQQLNRIIPKEALDYEIAEKEEGKKSSKIPTSIELRRWGKPFIPLDFQTDIINGINNLILKGSIKGLLSLPTGSGKTLTTCQLVLEALENLNLSNKGVVWIAPQKELLYQASEAFQASWWGGAGPPSLDIKIVNSRASFRSLKRPTCLLMTPNMAGKLIDELIDCSVIAIFDEAHHAAAEIFNDIWNEVCHSPKSNILLSLGLSATPARENIDEVHLLQQSFDNNLFIPDKLGSNPINTLIDQGVLSKPIFYNLDNIPLFSKHKGFADKRTMQSLILDKNRWERVVNMAASKELIGKTIIYSLDKSHGTALTKHLRYLGLTAEYVDGNTSLTLRNSIFERFRNGDTQFLINVKLLIEGIDCPSAENIILTYPTQAKIRLHQMVGRVLRGPKIGGTPEGKVYAMEGSQAWLDRILYRGDFRLAGWNVIPL